MEGKYGGESRGEALSGQRLDGLILSKQSQTAAGRRAGQELEQQPADGKGEGQVRGDHYSGSAALTATSHGSAGRAGQRLGMSATR